MSLPYGVIGKMLIRGRGKAQFMLFLAKLIGAKKILEVGTFTGYSALAWAEAIKGQEGAKVISSFLPLLFSHLFYERLELMDGSSYAVIFAAPTPNLPKPPFLKPGSSTNS